MKRISVILLLLLSVSAFCQVKPQTVYSVVKELRTESWYKEQAKLWKAEIDKNNQNAQAWYNYYMAIRALKNISDWESEVHKEYKTTCDQIVSDAYKAIPNSFEANHMMWYQSGHDETKLPYLMKAYEIDPYDSRTYIDLLTHYYLTLNQNKYEEFCEKLFKVNEISAPVYNWAYNMLSELDKNAIVFTAGDNDTYSPWVLQVVKNVRPDVTVINTSLLNLDDFRIKLLKEIDLSEFKYRIDEAKSYDEMFVIKDKLYQHIFSNKKGYPVYVSGTAISQFQKKFSDKLYLTGLTYKYSENSFDNVSLIIRNYEKRYLLDYLTQNFSFNRANSIADKLNATYLPAFVKLYNHYKETEEYQKLKKIKSYIIDISIKSGQETEISEILDAEMTMPNSFKSFLMNTKQIEKSFVKLEGNLYVNKYEVSNVEYAKFLNSIMHSELYLKCLYDSTKWNATNTEFKFNEPMVNLYHSHPAYNDYPVVNISHFAAEKYCEWLTQQYNTQRKRKYTKVVFRLPTEKEWEFAARGDKSSKKSPFKDDKILNEECKGCYYANLKFPQKDAVKYTIDGGFYTVKTGTYNPNSIGVFNVIGNAAEMIDIKNISKGGSWNSTFEESYINLRATYTEPNAETGFRIVMEVIQE